MEVDRMRIACVRSPQDDKISLLHLTVGAGPAPRSECCRQTDDAGSVSSAVAAVDVVGTHDLPRKLLRGKVHLVRSLGAAEHPECLRSSLPSRIEPLSRPIQGLLPGRGTQRAVLTNHRL